MDEEPRDRPAPEGSDDTARRPAPAGYGQAAGRTPDGPRPVSRSAQPAPDDQGRPAGTVYGRVVRFGPSGPGQPPGAPVVQQTPAPWPPAEPHRAPPVGPGDPVPPWAGFAHPAPYPAWTAGRATPPPPGPWGGMPPWPSPPRPSWAPDQYSPWINRVGADLLDRAPAYVASVLLLVSYVPLYVGLVRGDLTAQPSWGLLVVAVVLSLASFGWNVYNRWYVAGRTGQSLGKRVTRSWLVSAVDGRPIGMLNAFLRDLLHVLDGSSYVGYLWPLWDERRQTFADKIIDTVVVRTPVPPLTDDELARRH